MENYPSPDDALSDLRKKGYEADLSFETDPYGLYNGDLDLRLNPDAYHVDKSIQIEDPSHPDESETVYAISTSSGIKGTLTDMHSQNIASMLSTLAGIIREFNVPVDQYLREMADPVISNPFQSSASTGRIRIGGPGGSMVQKERSSLFSSAQIIEFTDWAAVQNASRLWDGLYTDVIKPLKKRDFHFIFHLGNVAKKLVFDIDEALDIIGDYSSFGKVMLMLDNDEISDLWGKLNGCSPAPGLSGPGVAQAKERCNFIFNTMNIDSLVVLHGDNAAQLSRDRGEVVLPGRPRTGNSEVINARERFSVGYQMGLLLQLDTLQCIALGLAVSKGYTEPSSGMGSAQLLAYIHNWVSDL